MGLGILEPRNLGHVPGTSRYYDDEAVRLPEPVHRYGVLKYDTNGSTPVILSPQPSDDPNDPLNWPLWRRDLITLTLCLPGVLSICLGSILASNTLVINAQFKISLDKAAVLTGYFLLGTGTCAIFCVPSGCIWGKRHLFLVGTCIVAAASAWAGATGSNYSSMAAARFIQGVGAAPLESLLNAAVGDLYCVHQRGVRMAFTNLVVFGAAFFTPVVAGKMTQSLGWQWTFNFVAIFTALTIPAVVLFCPETAYRRESGFMTDSKSDEVNRKLKSPSATDGASAPPHNFVLFPTSSAMQPIGDANTPKKSFLQALSLFEGRKTDERFVTLLLRPFPLLMNPAFVWACLMQGAMIGWTVFIGVIIAILFIGPPYFWSEVETGYTYTGPFIGAIFGFAVAGAFADSSVRYLTKLNRGIYEPEFRIFLAIPMLILGCIGLYGFGLTIDGRHNQLFPVVFFGFQVAGMVVGTVASSLYIADAYRETIVESFTLMIIFKNVFSFILTWYAFQWLTQSGIRDIMIIVASIQVGICLLSVLMCECLALPQSAAGSWLTAGTDIWGKRARAYFHRHDPLKRTGLR